MKKSLLLVTLLSFCFSVALGVEDARVYAGDKARLAKNIPVSYVPDVICIKLQATGKDAIQRNVHGVHSFAEVTLRDIGKRFQVSDIKPVFARAKREIVDGKVFDFSVFYKVRFSFGYLEQVVEAFAANPAVEWAGRIPVHAVDAIPNDYRFAEQWHLNQAEDHDIDAPEAWDIETGNSNLIVVIMDTGVRYFHKDLGGLNASYYDPTNVEGNMWVNWAEKNGVAGVDDDSNGFVDDWIGWDWVHDVSSCWPGEDCNDPDNDPRDFNGHGTHCAGNVSAINNNSYACAAAAGGWGDGTLQPTADGVKVMALRVGWSAPYFGWEVGYVRLDFVADAFLYAADNGAMIASCSFGSSYYPPLETAIDYFLSKGGMIFTSAGNDGTPQSDYMTGREDIISVAALDTNDCKADFSNYGRWVDISAPGTDILSLYHFHDDPENDYVAWIDGTSMSCPIVAGVAGLVWSKNPTWTAGQVEQRLYETVDNIYKNRCNKKLRNKLGAGRVNAYEAVKGGPGVDTIFVKSIDVTREPAPGKKYKGVAIVSIQNQDGAPGADATVWGHFTGPTSGNKSGATGDDGKVTLKSKGVRNPVGVWCFYVDSVYRSGDTYDPSRNKENYDCENTGSAKITAIPDRFELAQNRPNPFNPTTEISFTLPNATNVKLEIYNVMGQKVTTLVERYLEAGDYTFAWDGSNVASGVYLYRLEAGQFNATRKMMLLK